jgi:hypothetical protein
MVTIIDPPTFRDTRGLPEGYDPHKLYEYRFDRLKENASELEWFLYQYIPFGLIKSFAFAIDPTGQFKIAPGVITPENRLKYRAVLSVLQQRSYTVIRTVDSWAPLPNFGGIGGCTAPTATHSGFSTSFSNTLSSQEALPDTLKDTTSRTRLMGSKQGTLTMFKGHCISPPRAVKEQYIVGSEWYAGPNVPNDPCIVLAGGTHDYRDGGTDTRYTQTNGSGARLSSSTHNSLRLHEIAYNEGLIQSNLVNLLKGWSPHNRDATLFRNAVELRDIPHSIRSLRETMSNFRKLYASLARSPSIRKIVFDVKRTAGDIPNEYLSFHFGWKQTYKDLMDLLALPAKMTKKYNFLISRDGKPTTFRSKRSFVSGESGVSGFDYELLPNEYMALFPGDGVSSRIQRESELRLVINATFDFPPVLDVRFRSHEFLKRAGIIPRATDLYNLVPWTWLIDWFSGLGNYIELMDNINRDPSLINWGLITCVSKGKLITNYQSSSWLSVRHSVQNVETVHDDKYYHNAPHTSVYDYVCETRRDVATALDVKQTSEPSSLSAYQKSIIGALLAQRTAFSRPGTFRPRS